MRDPYQVLGVPSTATDDEVKKAYRDLARKYYGICRVTGKLISKERLRAVPHATLSMDAKMGQDS